MSGTKRPFTEADAERDRLHLQKLNAPQNRAKILGLIAVGHSLEHVIAVGAFHGSWTVEDVRATLSEAGVRPPAPAFGGGARPGPSAKRVKLTEVQVDVLREVCTGATVEQVAGRLYLGSTVVQKHIAAILRELDAVDRAHAISLVLTGRVRILPT